jgi:hypothetical protein
VNYVNKALFSAVDARILEGVDINDIIRFLLIEVFYKCLTGKLAMPLMIIKHVIVSSL